MAMMDNVDFLISHIRNSFVTSDDTSMSEWIITECRFQEEPDLKRDGNFKYVINFVNLNFFELTVCSIPMKIHLVISNIFRSLIN